MYLRLEYYSCMKKKTYLLRFDDGLKERLEAVADGRPLSYLINKAISDYLDNKEK